MMSLHSLTGAKERTNGQPRRKLKRLLPALFFLLLTSYTPAQTDPQTAAPAGTKAGDPVERIKDEGLHRSQLMETLTYLTEVIGPRLTNSPNFRRAADWTRDRLASWGLENSHLEPWGPFGRGWSVRRFSVQIVEPQNFPLIAYPKAWSPGTEGERIADVIALEAKTEADLKALSGKIHGKIVLTRPIRNVETRFRPLATRWSDSDMLMFANDQPFPPDNPELALKPSADEAASRKAAAQFRAAALSFLTEEGAALLVEPSLAGDGGTVTVMSASVPQPFDTPRDKRIFPWNASVPRTVPQIVVSAEQYNRMMRMIQFGQKLKMAADLDVEFDDRDLMSSNTIAEIPGTDRRDEVVMIGAHLDSWHAGTGATDNGTGVAVVMEAMRILEALKLQPRRTIRVALWGGEEEPGGGSRAYVEQHFARLSVAPANEQSAPSPRKIALLPEYDKLSGYFNIDAGSGKIRGVYLQGNEALRSIFRPWLDPLRELGVSTLTVNSDWSSDFEWFEQAGLPNVSFIQDELDYETRTHHTNQDVLDRVVPEDLKQAAVVMAAFVYQTAMRDEKLPRKPLR